nr:MAG TPA: hypothetical protein [Caudoviricetes sp.]
MLKSSASPSMMIQEFNEFFGKWRQQQECTDKKYNSQNGLQGKTYWIGI